MASKSTAVYSNANLFLNLELIMKQLVEGNVNPPD